MWMTLLSCLPDRAGGEQAREGGQRTQKFSNMFAAFVKTCLSALQMQVLWYLCFASVPVVRAGSPEGSAESSG